MEKKQKITPTNANGKKQDRKNTKKKNSKSDNSLILAVKTILFFSPVLYDVVDLFTMQ